MPLLLTGFCLFHIYLVFTTHLPATHGAFGMFSVFEERIDRELYVQALDLKNQKILLDPLPIFDNYNKREKNRILSFCREKDLEKVASDFMYKTVILDYTVKDRNNKQRSLYRLIKPRDYKTDGNKIDSESIKVIKAIKIQCYRVVFAPKAVELYIEKFGKLVEVGQWIEQ